MARLPPRAAAAAAAPRGDVVPALELAVEEAREQMREELEDVIREVTLLSIARDGRIAALESIALNSG